MLPCAPDTQTRLRAGLTKFKMDIKVPGEGGTILGTCGQSSMIQIEEMSTYILEVAKGMDLLGMLCLAVAVDDMKDEN